MATSGGKSDSDRWRRNLGVSSNAGQAGQALRIAQLYANEQRISRATTNSSEESVSGAHTSPSRVHARQDRITAISLSPVSLSHTSMVHVINL